MSGRWSGWRWPTTGPASTWPARCTPPGASGWCRCASGPPRWVAACTSTPPRVGVRPSSRRCRCEPSMRSEPGGAVTAIRLLLVDDHEVVRTGLRTFLELQDDMEVVGEAGTAERALA